PRPKTQSRRWPDQRISPGRITWTRFSARTGMRARRLPKSSAPKYLGAPKILDPAQVNEQGVITDTPGAQCPLCTFPCWSDPDPVSSHLPYDTTKPERRSPVRLTARLPGGARWLPKLITSRSQCSPQLWASD